MLVNVATIVGVLLYVQKEGAREVAEQRAQVLREMLGLQLSEFVDRGLKDLLSSNLSESELLLRIRGVALFDQATFQRLVRKAVLVRTDGHSLSPTTFNVRRRYIFDEGTLNNGVAFEMVAQSQRENRLIERDGGIAGPLRSRGVDWGGFYLSLAEIEPPREAGPTWVRLLLFVLLPSVLFLIWFLWFFLSRGVLHPIEELGAVARAVARGDYSRRLPTNGRQDEIGRLNAVTNRMLDLVEDYRNTMEAKVAEKTKEIETKNRELLLGQRLAATGTLAAGIAHEINNPLGGMLNAANRLRRTELSPEQRERYILLLEECIGRIGGIVSKVLSLSPRKMTPTRLDLGHEVRKVIELAQHHAAERQVHLDLSMSEPAPVVLGEVNEVAQIFLNLILNGIDACDQGGKVLTTVAAEGTDAVITVTDTGHGMTPDVAAQAFNVFFTTKEAGRGTGLGLAIVHSLVVAHGGRITFKTDPGLGTSFTVRLPMVPELEGNR